MNIFHRELLNPKAGLANLRHAERFSWHAAFTVRQISLFLTWPASLYREEHVLILICMETVYELPFLPNHTTSETFLHKSRALRSVDWIFITGALTWRWMSEYVTLDRSWKSFQTGRGSRPTYSYIVFSSALLGWGEASIKKIMIILRINYDMH